MKKLGLALAALLVVPALVLPAGCAGPTYIVQQYDGPARPSESVAVIRVDGEGPELLTSLDGEDIRVRIPDDSRLHLEVLPGPHRVGVADARLVVHPPEILSFVAEAGKWYRPVVAALAPGSAGPNTPRVRIYEVSKGDVLLRDVTIVPTPSPALVEEAPTDPLPSPVSEPEVPPSLDEARPQSPGDWEKADQPGKPSEETSDAPGATEVPSDDSESFPTSP